MPHIARKSSRKEQILQALAHMLQTSPGKKITTSALAQEVGVSEAALYRHFPSKAKMFEGLINFIEDSLFTRINHIIEEEKDSLAQCQLISMLILGFAENNPGITRILTGDALAGETERLRKRVEHLFEHLETQLRKIFREAALKEQRKTVLSISETANLMLALIEGRISQFVRSEFQRPPTENWNGQWQLISEQIYTV